MHVCRAGLEALTSPHFMSAARTEAECLDIIGTKVLRVLLLAIHSHSCNVKLYTETSSLRTLKIMLRNLNGLCVHEFGFNSQN